MRSNSVRSGSTTKSCNPNHDTPPNMRTDNIPPSPSGSASQHTPTLSSMRTESICSSPTASERSKHRNVLIVGDVGAGKSSLVNLICGKDLATTSNGAKSCTLKSTEYDVTLGDVGFSLHDTAGLHEAVKDMRKTDYLDAVYQAHALISRLERSGGISLLVFCMKGGRVSISMQQTYSLFAEVFCNRQVPVVVVVTNLEMYDCMEQWWTENEKAIKEYGLRAHGHACITATRGYKGVFTERYEESRGVVRKLLLEYSGREAWKEEKSSWVKRVVLHMRGWLSPRRVKQLDASDLRKKLTRRCGFAPEVADEVAQKIEQTRGMSRGGALEEDKSWFDEKFGNDASSCLSLPVVSYTS